MSPVTVAGDPKIGKAALESSSSGAGTDGLGAVVAKDVPRRATLMDALARDAAEFR
jgi:hypothetical protein